MVVVMLVEYVSVFFLKQKTAYEMRISDWSSDVCSSDLSSSVRRAALRPDGCTAASGTLSTSRAEARMKKTCAVICGFSTWPGFATSDRKSTRLNSSH